MSKHNYRCEALNRDAFVAQLIRYISGGHYFYITGKIPERKDPAAIDAKLLKLYDIDKPYWKRTKRYRGDCANVHYLRHNRFFVLIATHGKHLFFDDHATTFRDIRRNALLFSGYSIRYTYSEKERRHKVNVRLDRPTYLALRGQLQTASTRSASSVREHFDRIGYQPYHGVRRQILSIMRHVNVSRHRAGLATVSIDLGLRRRASGTSF